MNNKKLVLFIIIMLISVSAIMNCEQIRVAVTLYGQFVSGGEVDAWFDGNSKPPAQHYTQTQLVYDFDAPHVVEGAGVNAKVIHNGQAFFDWVVYDPNNVPTHLFVDVYNN